MHDLLGTSKKRYYFSYSILFFITFSLSYYYFARQGKSFLRSYDGLDQHYVFFVYIGKWVRQIIYGLLHEHTLSIPMWTFELGYGADIITSSGAYIGDPFNWLSIFCPVKYTEVLFNLILVAKMYVAGIIFSIYSFHHNHSPYSTLCGALLYSLCGVMLIAPIEAFFINPMILFPLLIWGAEKSLKGGSPLLYMITLALSFINYFYFAYMMSVFVFLFCVIWCIFNRKNLGIKNWGKLFFKFVISSCAGIMAAAVLLLPIVAVMVSVGRLGLEREVPAFYSFSYYLHFLEGLFNSANIGPDSYIGFTPIGVLCCLLLLFKEKNSILKVSFIILTFIACIPTLGRAMNGFGYVANRWVWAYAFCVCYTIVCILPKILAFKSSFLIPALFWGGIFVLFLAAFQDKMRGSTMRLAILFLVYLAVLLIFNHRPDIKKIITLCTLSLFIIITTRSVYSPSSSLISRQIPFGSALNQHTKDSASRLIKEMNAPGVWRYDTYNTGRIRNNGLIQDLKSIDFYISIYNNNIDQFHKEIALFNAKFNMEYTNLDSNPILTHLLGVQYFLIKSNDLKNLPFGYSNKVIEERIAGEDYSIYSSDFALPLAFSYYKTLSRAQYDRLSPLEKQAALLEYCVLEKDEQNEEPAIPIEVVFSTLSSAEKIEINDGLYIAKEKGAKLSFNVSDLGKGYNYFVYFENLQYDGLHGSSYKIGISNGTIKKTLGALTNASHMYGGKHDWLANLGTSDFKNHKLEITFNQKGTYSFDSIQVLRLPISFLESSFVKLQKAGAEDISVSANTITCSRNTRKDEILFLSCPYSIGWKAFVNDKPIKIEKVNTAFIGIPLTQGENRIILKYETPMLREGIMISILGILSFFMIHRYYRGRDESIRL